MVLINDELKDFCEQEVKRIAQKLKGEKFLESKEHIWKSLDLDPDGNFSFSTKFDLYSGQAGILRFIEAWSEFSSNREYQDLFINGVEALIINYEPHNSSGAYLTGSLGIAEFLIESGIKYDKQNWINKGREIALIRSPRVRADDFINGHAGRLYGLCSIHSYLKDDVLLPLIEKEIDFLCQNAHLWKKGFYWDRDSEQVKGLCGFSHGSGGVGFALMQAGVYFHHQELVDFGKKGIEYEDYWFNDELKNWPDLRKGLYNEAETKKYLAAFEKVELAPFVDPYDMNAWCHGASGIGLARVGVKSLLQTDKLDDSILNSVKRFALDMSKPQEKSLGIICHGWLGNMDLLIEANGVGLCPKYEQLITNTLESVKSNREKNGMYMSGYGTKESAEDSSLFMGNSGIAYQLLRLLNPELPSVLLPKNLQKSMFSLSPECIEKVQQNLDFSNLDSSEWSEAIKLDFSLNSHLLADLFERSLKDNFDVVPSDQLLSLDLKVHPGIKIIEDGEDYMILKSFAQGVKSYEAGQLSALLLSSFEDWNKGTEGINRLLNQFDDEDKDEAKPMLEKQLIELAEAGFLINSLSSKMNPWESQ